ncbi:S-adenosyl-L-methionine-dependent methyltransferase [Desarmillaria tabescens]|uniref:S-adenosyl-L-methionine-dependent methyltransferase n=1 Tax=Armillaria tabescens TaxID=1929756 RepID=A0AA39NK05_ARMTA|nr:S-adenosyl-L-methionine-dependent methyltransferase [Desarmillaria tabescens]KAK0466997.1 S-adenosyl-L-methionine-dependent methyltransferase [Desarmillaria tabescens]
MAATTSDRDQYALKPYQLPTDVAEMKRLGLQHRLWCLMIGGLYPTSIADALQNIMRENAHPTIADIGCGSAVWAMEMARLFPEGEVVGFDLHEQTYADAPKNFRFMQSDLAEGLPESLRGTFDVIHCRCVAQHVPNPVGLISDIAEALKPGGLLLLADGDWVAFDEDKRPLVPFIYNPAINEQERHRCAQPGSSFYAGWLHLMGNITRSPVYRPIDQMLLQHGGFVDVSMQNYFSPINWNGRDLENGTEMGAIMNLNMKAFFHNSVKAAIKSGVAPGMLPIWEEEYLKEFGNRRYNIWHYTTARKMGISSVLEK